MTVPQLKDIARSNNLKNWSRLKKADLIQFLIDNVPRGAVGGLPPSRGRGRTPRRRSPSPAPRPRTPSPRPIPPSPPRTPSPSSGLRRPRSRTPSRSLRRRSPARIPSGPFGIAKLKKRQCVRNLRKDVVAVAEDYGISITKADGKKKTIKELCVEIDIAGAQQLPMPVAATPPRTHTPSPLQIPRPITPPILESVPTGMIPRAVVYALLNIDRDMTKADLLKPKVLNKPTLVRYAEELGIKGKSLTKEVLLDRIVAAQVARDMPVMAQAIEDESEVIADEIVDHVSEMVIAAGEQPPAQEEVQAVVQQRVSTGESVNSAIVADEIIAEQQSEDIIERPEVAGRGEAPQPSSRRSLSSVSSSRRSLSPQSSFLSSQVSSLLSRSSMSSITRSSVASSVEVASNISNKVAEDIVDEVADRTDISSVRRTIDEVVEEQGVNLDIDSNKLEEVVSDEQAREAVESVVDRATDEGLISKDEGSEILQPLKDEVSAVAAAAIRTGARPKVIQQRSSRRSQPITRQIRGEQDIERLLREIQKPEESINNMPLIQNKVFRCLGVVN